MRTRLKSSPLPLRGRLRRELRYASQGIAAAAFADVICLAFGADVTAIAIVGAIGAGGGCLAARAVQARKKSGAVTASEATAFDLASGRSST